MSGAAPWEDDPVVQQAPAQAGGSAAPWESDPVVERGAREAPQQSGGILQSALNLGQKVWDYGTAPIRALADPQKWTGAAEGVLNDISGGQQGVNPTALSEQRGKAVGVLKTLPGTDTPVVDVDGTLEPAGNYPADRFVTRQENGRTYIYPRTADIEEGRLASAGRMLGYGAPETFGAAAKAAAAPSKAAPSKAAQVSQAAEDIGVTPSFAMRGKVAGKVAAAGEMFAPTAGQFLGDGRRVAGELGKAAGRIADAAGPGATAVDAGEALQRGADVFVSRVRDMQGKLYGKVDEAIPPGTAISAPETRQFLEQEVSALAGSPNIAQSLGMKKLEGWLQDIQSGLTWETARKLRTDIGESIGKISGPLADQAQGRLKALYGTLTRDLDAAADAAGPEAAHAWGRANAFTRASNERIDGALAKVITAESPEKAYSALTNMAMASGPKANIGNLREVFRSLPRDDAATVAGTIIRNLGKATAGAQDASGEVFSANTFLTNWNKMDPDARAIIASNGLDPGVGQQLSKLATVIERAKEADTFRNTSHTGNVASAAALGGGFFAAPLSTIATALATNIGARALTSETFLHALNRFAATGKSDALVNLANGSGPEAIEAAKILQLQAGSSSPQSQPIPRGTATYSYAP